MAKIEIVVAGRDQGATSTLDEVGKSLEKLTKTGAMLSAGLTLPLLAAGKAALGVAMDYEGASNIFQATTGATAEQMARLGKLSQDLGADMDLPNTSAADASMAMNELAKAGLRVDDVFTAAKGTLQLAATDALSEAEAAQITANALNAFGLAGADAGRVADLLAAAANASSASVRDVADSMQMVSAIAASANIPIEDITAALGEMANKGIKGSDAGTSLKQMILSLQAPTKQAAGLMEELGVSVYDKATGSMKPLRDVIANVSAKLGPLSDAQRNQAMATLFGSDAIRAANIVLVEGTEAYDKMHESVTREGSAAELSSARMKGLGGAIAGLKSQVETLLLTAAIPLTRNLESIARNVAGLISKLTEADPALLNSAIAFGAVLAAAGPLMLAIGAIGSAVAFIASPLGMVTVAVGLLAAAWTANVGDIQGKTAALWAAIQPVLEQLASWLEEYIPKAVEALGVIWNKVLLPALQAAWAFIEATLIPVLKVLATVAIGWVKTEVRALELLWQNALLPAMRAVGNFIQNTLIPALDNLASFITDTVAPKLQFFTDNVISPLASAFQAIGDAVGWVIDRVNDLIDALSNLSLPDAFTPGSPTPFETGLRGIAAAMRDIQSIDLSEAFTPRVSLTTTFMASGAGVIENNTRTGQSVVILEIGTMHVNDKQDAETLAYSLAGIIARRRR